MREENEPEGRSEVEEQTTEGYTSGQRREDVTSIFFIMESQCKQASVSSPKREKVPETGMRKKLDTQK